MGHIIHVELTSSDPAGPGIDGAIMDSSYQSQSVIAWIEVADINAAVEAVIAAGGNEAGDISQIPGVGYVSYAADPNGVLIGLRQPVQSAPGLPRRSATR